MNPVKQSANASPDQSESQSSQPGESLPKPGGPYAYYVLIILFLVYVFNFLDRQIMSILNEAKRADLGLSDAQMGFLYGTAFAVFYAVFGLPLGRLADTWNRKNLISIGLGFWSLMTVLSGFAKNFTQLGAARIGVGIGEATATPAAFSMLGDYFPARLRATVLAIYASGVYVGVGLSLGIGGAIVDNWDSAYAAQDAPFGLSGWQVAFFAVGMPGLVLAAWVASLREPIRGMADGIRSPVEPHPFREFLYELRAVVPPFTIYHLVATRAPARTFTINLTAALLLALAAWFLVAVTGSAAQWIAVAVGLYASFSWCQNLARRDSVTFKVIFRTPSLVLIFIGYGGVAFISYGTGYWTAPYFMRTHGISAAEAGLILGGTAAAAGFLGITLGGIVGDRLRARFVTGRIWVGLFVTLAVIPLGLILFSTESLMLAYIINFPFTMISAMFVGPATSTMQDLVLPRMRGTCGAVYLLAATFIGLALGPFTIGQLSSMLDDDLGSAILIGLMFSLVAFALLILVAIKLPEDQGSLRARARAAGEHLSEP